MEYKELQKTIEKLDNGVYEICIKNGRITKINKEKNLTPYQKTEYFLSNYPGLKNRKEYLKKSLDNIELKKIYSINEIKATNKDNLSDVEKIEMIKEERIKEIHEIDYLVDFIDYGLSFVQDDKYKEIIENEESDLSKKIKELEILANNPISELRNDIDKIQEQINSSYCKVFSSSGIHLNIGIGDIGFDPAKSLLSGSRIDISETGNFARWDQQGTGSQRALFWSILQVRSELSRVSDIQKELQKLESKKAQSSKDKEKIQNLKSQLSQDGSSDFFLPGYMLLIDEPETGLHPSAVRAAKEHLYNLASEAGWQVMLSTHHPAFVDPIKDHTTIVRLHRLDKHLEPNIYKSETINFSDDELANLKALMVFDSNVSEIFFGDKVVIVEGDTEFAAFHEIMNSNSTDYPVNQRPLIIRARGKATIAILIKILSHFKIDFSVLHDIDSPKTSAGNRANSAYSINKTISDTVTEARKAGLNVTYRCSCPNFEIHHQMDLPSKDKPFRSWKAVQEQGNVRSSIETVLKELISVCNDIPSNDGTNYEDTLKNWIALNHKQDELCYKF